VLEDRYPIDFSFRAFLNRRKGLEQERERAAENFAYSGDIRIRRALARLRPVQIIVEATVRIWKQGSRGELSGEAIKVSDRQFPDLMKQLKEVGRTLDAPLPMLYVSGRAGIDLEPITLGTSEEAHVILPARLIESAGNDPAVLRFILGTQLGRVSSGHVIYLTALHYLEKQAFAPLRLMAGPATVALRAWARRAILTSDRAGLIACRDLGAAQRALALYSLGGARGEQKDRPSIEVRSRALELYAGCKDYRARTGGGDGGRSRVAVDEEIGRLLGGKDDEALPGATTGAGEG
jgi:hypothetical protein